MDSYLTLASKVLREARQPLSARQILHAAYQLRLVPEDLYGKTQHKTLQARLSEDILHFRSKSLFVRTEPGRFFLRSYLHDATIPERHKKEHFAPLRANQLKNFYVACVQIELVALLLAEEGPVLPSDSFLSQKIIYHKLSRIGEGSRLVSIRVFVIIQNNGDILIGRRNSPMGDELDGELSVGVSGFVKQDDHTLFSVDNLGLREAASRTLYEQLHVLPSEIERCGESALRCVGFIADLNRPDFGNSISAVVIYGCPPNADWISSLNSENYRWHDPSKKTNDVEQFDPWSQLLLSNDLLQKVTFETL